MNLAKVISVRHANDAAESLEKYDLIDQVPPPYQLLIINKVFGESIQKNAMFKDLGIYFIVELLKEIETRMLARGEYLYSANMPSDSSTRI